MLQSGLCDYIDAYIAAKGTITVIEGNNKERKNRSLAFKNNTPFVSCMSKVNYVLFDNAEDLYIVIPMCSLIEYSKTYRKKAGRLEDYYTDVPNNPPIYPSTDYNPPTISYNADPVTNSASFKYKSSIIRKTPNKNNNVNNNKKMDYH